MQGVPSEVNRLEKLKKESNMVSGAYSRIRGGHSTKEEMDKLKEQERAWNAEQMNLPKYRRVPFTETDVWKKQD